MVLGAKLCVLSSFPFSLFPTLMLLLEPSEGSIDLALALGWMKRNLLSFAAQATQNSPSENKKKAVSNLLVLSKHHFLELPKVTVSNFLKYTGFFEDSRG